MSRVIIAEKPSVAASIANIVGAIVRKDGYFEGSGYVVSWCYGHLVSQSPPEKYGVVYDCAPYNQDLQHLPLIPQEWRYEIIQQNPRKGETKAESDKRKLNNASTKKQFEIIKNLLHGASEIICATDAGREGELIFRNVYNFAQCKKSFKRLWISSLEESAIREGLSSLRPGSDFDNLYKSGLCRAKADWLIGMNGSRLFSSLYKANLSIGRVQTPTLAMIVERDYKVKNFIKEKYFIIELDCGDFIAVSEKIEDVANAMQIMNDCKGKNAVVSNLKKEKKTQNPPKLYDLTTLQREANRLFSFSAQETLDAAQKLYEQKLVTYPRTDSQFITDDMADSTANIVANLCSKLNLDKPDIEIKRVVNAAKVSDHHAILPTAHSLNADLSSLSERDKAVLNLVTLKLLCATAQPYIYESVTAEIKCGGHSFTAKGRSDISAGWKHTEARVKSALGIKVITNDEKDEKDDSQAEKSLNVSENQAFDNPVCSLAEKFTSPPKHFTEDTLLSAMETAGNKDYVADSGVEKRGIGTPATRANVIESLIFKGFILRKGKLILGSEKGVNLIKIAPDKLKSAALTAEWETALQNIEKSKASADSFMAEIEDLTRNLVAENAAVRAESASAFSQPLEAKASLGKCPKCGGEVTETPKAYSCGGGRGECKFVLWKSQFYKENALSAAQAKKLLERGKTDLIKGFVSKAKGTKYDAFLVLKSDFSVGLSFE